MILEMTAMGIWMAVWLWYGYGGFAVWLFLSLAYGAHLDLRRLHCFVHQWVYGHGKVDVVSEDIPRAVVCSEQRAPSTVGTEDGVQRHYLGCSRSRGCDGENGIQVDAWME